LQYEKKMIKKYLLLAKYPQDSKISIFSQILVIYYIYISEIWFQNFIIFITEYNWLNQILDNWKM
jgi:hypothetical protein